jgi:hypothetical protein
MDGKLFKTTYQQRKRNIQKTWRSRIKKICKKYKNKKDQQCKKGIKVKNEDANPLNPYALKRHMQL